MHALRSKGELKIVGSNLYRWVGGTKRGHVRAQVETEIMLSDNSKLETYMLLAVVNVIEIESLLFLGFGQTQALHGKPIFPIK